LRLHQLQKNKKMDISTYKRNQIEKIAKDIRNIVLGTKTENRKDLIHNYLCTFLHSWEWRFVEDEKPHTGRVGAIIEMKDCFRINYRCGYGKWNYAPVIELS